MRFLSSTWLSLSAFTPTLLLLALILHPQLGLWSWVLAGCGAVSVTLTGASVASLSRRQATPLESTSVRRRDTEVYALTFASLLPIAPALLIDNAGSASVVSLGLTALLVMLHLRGGLFHLNALFALVGYRCYLVTGTNGVVTMMLTRAQHVPQQGPLQCRHLSDDVAFQCRATAAS